MRKLIVLAGLLLALAGCAKPVSETLNPVRQVTTVAPVNAPSPTAAPADVTVGCKIVEGADGADSPAAYFVELDTTTFVNVSEIDVTVIGFSDGQQEDTGTVTFTGPFAGGQVFVNDQTDTPNPGDTTCAVASLDSSEPLSYDNLSPVPGGAS